MQSNNHLYELYSWEDEVFSTRMTNLNSCDIWSKSKQQLENWYFFHFDNCYLKFCYFEQGMIWQAGYIWFMALNKQQI